MTFQGPTVRTCRAKLGIQVGSGQAQRPGWLVEDTAFCLSMRPGKAQVHLPVSGGLWE